MNKAEELKNDQDAFLLYLVRLAEEVGITVGVTLFVGGITLSGRIVSGRSFFEAVSDELFDHVPKTGGGEQVPDGGAMIAEWFETWANEYPPRPTALPTELSDKPLSYVHLLDCHIVRSEGVFQPKDGMPWRGRLDRIDGISICRLD